MPRYPSHTNLNLMIQHYIGVELKEEVVGCYVEGRDDLLRVSDQLGVEFLIIAQQMTAIDGQEGLQRHSDLWVGGEEGVKGCGYGAPVQCHGDVWVGKKGCG